MSIYSNGKSPASAGSAHVQTRELLVGWAQAALRIVIATALLSLLAIRSLGGAPATNHFTFLANAFLHGTFSVGTLPDSYADTITVGNQTFLPLGPAPAMLLIPFVSLFGVAFDEFWLALLLTLVNVWLMDLVLQQIGVGDKQKRRWLLLLFFLGTIYLAAMVLGRSWFLAHIGTTTFLLLAIYLSLRGKAPVLIGLLLGMSFLTRSTTGLALLFFLILAAHRGGRPRLMRDAFWSGVGLVGPMAFFLIYNYVRFGSLFETGYASALPGAPVLRTALSYGLFSPVHIPKNLYMLFLSPPQPVPNIDAPAYQFPWILPSRWGMGIFFTTPAFVYAFVANHRSRVVQAAWVVIIAILPFLLTYYGVGYDQFGYRYAMDFYPFLFILTALGINSRWNSFAKTLIVVSVFVSVWGAWCALFGLYAGPV